jgi:hypothetical protein
LNLIARRPTLVAALVSLALAAVMVGPGLLPGRALSTSDRWWFTTPWSAERPADLEKLSNSDLADAAQQFVPLRTEVKRQLPSPPLWNPWIAGGRPLLADAQAAVYSPFSLPAYVMPLQKSLAWTALLTLWAATFGMYLLGRALGMRFAGALLAGIVYGLNLWLVAHLSYPHSGVWALLPWMLWATERLVRRPSASSVAVLAVPVALQFLAGHPETSFQVLLGTVAFFALRLVQARGSGVRKPLLAMGAALVAGTALAAVMLAPFAELLLHSADLGERSGTGIGKHVDPTYILGFFMYDYWGRATDTPVLLLLFSRSWYIGALPLMLAAAALIVRPRGERLWIALFGAVLLAIIFGVPPFLQIGTRLPLLSLGHNDRLVLLVLACAALLAGWGLDDLRSRELPARAKRGVLIAGAVILVVPLVMVLARSDIGPLFPKLALKVAFHVASPPPVNDPNSADVVRLAAVALWVCAAGAALLLLALRVGGLPQRVVAGLALGLVVVDLLRAGMGYNPAIHVEHAQQPETGAQRYLAARGQERFVAVGDVPQNVAALSFRIEDARGYDPPILKRYNELWRREVSPEFPDLTATLTSYYLQVPRLDERRLRTLRLLGVTSVLAPPESAGLQPPGLDTPGLRRVYNGRDAQVFHVEGALPRTFVAGAQRTVNSGDDALATVTGAGFAPREVAVTERRVPGIGGASGESAGTARIVRYEPDHVRIDADLTKPGIVVLGDNWYPGWKATVDGKDVDVERVDYVMRGTVASAGRHVIDYRYQPSSWRIGWIVSLLALLSLATAVVLERRRRA